MITTLALILLGGMQVDLSVDLQVELRAYAQVCGTEITLGEIASLSGGSKEELKRARQISLGYAPAPDYSRILRSANVRAILNKKLKPGSFLMSGAVRCVVTPSVEHITVLQQRAAMESGLRDHFRGSEPQLQLIGALREVTVPKGAESSRIVAALGERIERGTNWSIPLCIYVDGTVYQRIWTTWSIGLWGNSQVLRRAVKRGDVFTADMFEMRRVRILPGQPADTFDPRTLLGSVFTRDLAAGDTLQASHLGLATVLRRDDPVQIEVRSGLIIAKATGIALQDARIGDRIRVRIANSSERVLSGIVINKNLVRIELK